MAPTRGLSTLRLSNRQHIHSSLPNCEWSTLPESTTNVSTTPSKLGGQFEWCEVVFIFLLILSQRLATTCQTCSVTCFLPSLPKATPPSKTPHSAKNYLVTCITPL
jgi:hypothetical protein